MAKKMVLCERCRKRKAKRTCIALNQSLCPLCCGKLREKEISCPPDCSFLKAHLPYQEKRIISKKHELSRKKMSPDKDPLKDERLAWLALHIEIPLKEQADRITDLKDKDALLALEYARDVIQKEKALVFVPDEKPIHKSSIGDAVIQSVQNCRFERKIFMPGDNQHYTQEEKLLCLDRIILSLKNLMQDDLDSTDYLLQLTERFSKIRDLSRQQKILTPS
jgi:hypothetical protein